MSDAVVVYMGPDPDYSRTVPTTVGDQVRPFGFPFPSSLTEEQIRAAVKDAIDRMPPSADERRRGRAEAFSEVLANLRGRLDEATVMAKGGSDPRRDVRDVYADLIKAITEVLEVESP